MQMTTVSKTWIVEVSREGETTTIFRIVRPTEEEAETNAAFLFKAGRGLHQNCTVKVKVSR